jgi:hypothetical protein
MMFRWIVIVLVICLPLRSGLAAAQWCPWIANSQAIQTIDNPTPPMTEMSEMAEMGEGCAGMSKVDGTCTLQTACFATPVLCADISILSGSASPQKPFWQAHVWANINPQMPLRVPILRL